jgi:Do/DeqQ family serine protease
MEVTLFTVTIVCSFGRERYIGAEGHCGADKFAAKLRIVRDMRATWHEFIATPSSGSGFRMSLPRNITWYDLRHAYAHGTAAKMPGPGSPQQCGTSLRKWPGGLRRALLMPPRTAYIRGDFLKRVRMFRHFRRVAAIAVFAALLAGTSNPATAQDRRVPASAAELRLSYAPIVQRVQPAVVNVYAAKVIQNRNPLLDDPIFRRFFGTPDQQPEKMQRSLGSGVMVDPSGLVVTNNHVIEGADQVKVSLSDKREFEAEIVLKDTHSDLAVLRLKDAKEKFPTMDFANSDELLVGDVVLAIGNPFGVGQTVTHGIVSALARTQVGITDYQFFIQTDAAINPGNSGGALVDMTGKLVGINTAIFSRSGGSQGIGFAIPANMVKVVVASAKSGGKAVKRPWLGARLQSVTPEIAETLGLKVPNGALVASVSPNSPASRAGLKLSDLIVAVDGQPIDDINAFDYRFATRQLGGTAQLDVQRDGKPVKLTVALETAPDTGRDEITLTSRSPFQGATVSNISPAVADDLKLDASTEGVVVTNIADDATAASVGFQKGDIIVAVNNQRISKTSDLERAARANSRLWRITVVRGGQQINVTLGG